MINKKIFFVCGALVTALFSMPAQASEENTDTVSAKDVGEFYQFRLDGVEYQLPCPLSEFEENGWMFEREADAEKKIPGMTIQSCNLIKEEDSSEKISVQILNNSGNAAYAELCQAAGIRVERGSLSALSLFETIDGISLSDSYEEVKNVYGEPKEYWEESGIAEYSFRESPDEMILEDQAYKALENSDVLKIKIGEDESSLESIDMAYYKEAEDMTEISERPEYLGVYTRPETLGDEILTFTFELDGVFYQMPAPVSEFSDNGWLCGQSASIPGLNKVITHIQKTEGEHLIVTIVNDSENLVATEDAYLSKIKVTREDAEDGVSFLLAGGITVDSSMEEVFEKVPAWEDMNPGDEVEKDDIVYLCVGEGCYYLYDETTAKCLTICEEANQVKSIELEGYFSSAD